MELQLIRFFIRHRVLVLICLALICLVGVRQYGELPVDAFPDVSPVMVPIFAEAHGMAPEEIERLITFPIESVMNGLPGVTLIKSTSAFGLAVIYVYFEDGIDIYFARQIVSERLNEAMAKLPEMHEPPVLGPISTGLGQIFVYYLTLEPGTDTKGMDPGAYLRDLNDWVVKYQLQTVRGVTDILSMGGHVLQYQIKVNPHALTRYQLSIEDVVEAVQHNNRNAGGQFLVLGNEEYLVRGIGLLETLDHLKQLPVKVVNAVPLRLEQIADIGFGHEIRRGVVTHNGVEEVVSGIVMQLYGANTSKVIASLYERIDAVKRSLPKGVKLVSFYEQAELVDKATWTVKKSLLLGSILVIICLTLFLGHLGSALIVALALPISALLAIIFMNRYGISANLMSLGGIAIAIGMLCDGSIVVVENIYRNLRMKKGDREEIIVSSAAEVIRPVVFSLLIIIAVFLPVLTLEGVEGKMFSPMAITVSAALFGSLVFALVAVPVLAIFLLKNLKQKEFFIVVWLKNLYRPLLTWTVKHPWPILLFSLLFFVGSILLVPQLGTEFIPVLEEGSLMVGVTMSPSISLEKATETIMSLEKVVLAHPQVKETISRIGRPEAGSHPHPVNYAEIHGELTSHDEWPTGLTKAKMLAELAKEMATVPGVQLNFTQPIQNAFDELLSGIKAQLAVKVFGEDIDVLRETAEKIRQAVKDVPGLVDLSTEQSFGQPQVQIVADREACSRFGVTISEILELVEMAIGGEVVDQVFLNTRRYGILVRYNKEWRSDIETIRRLLVRTADGNSVPLSQVAEIRELIGPVQVNREGNSRRWTVTGNIRGRDLGSVVEEMKKQIAEKVKLPVGYWVKFGGQFENQQRAMARLSIIVPLVILAVFLMLFLTFNRLRDAVVIILNVPLALIGGVAGLYLTGEYLSVPAAVGFIALFGIAVQNGMVLVACIRQIQQGGLPLTMALIEGGVTRLRPVLMTAFTTVLGLLPLLLSTGIGSEVQRPLATVVVYGLISSTLLTLFVLPATYRLLAAKEEQVTL